MVDKNSNHISFEQSTLMLIIILSFSSTLVSMQVLAMLFSLVFVFLYRQVIININLNKKSFFILLLSAMVLTVPINLWRTPSVLPYIFIEGVSIILALILSSNTKKYYQASRIVLIVYQALIVGYLIYMGIDEFPLENIIPGASSNGVTSYLILLQCNYGIARFVATQRVSIFTSIITIGICIIGFGRGSIVASLGLFALNAMFFFRQCRELGRLWPAITVAIIGLLSYSYWDIASDFLDANTKLGAGFVDDSRSSILKAYLDNLDPWSLIRGASYDGTGVYEEYRGNPHNSFIRAHHLYGLPYLVCIFFLLVWVFLRKMPAAVKIYSFIAMLMLLIRAFTEPILFPSLLDVFFFSMCLTLYQANQNSEASIAH